MFNFTLGQRWISEMEPELGLGSLIDISDNQISVDFSSSSCIRRYALRSAPLKRVKFAKGDLIVTKANETFKVDEVKEIDGLYFYRCGNKEICEKALSANMSFTSPKDRLNAGFFDSNGHYNLRYEANCIRYRMEKSDVSGFRGGKIDLIPHQFFIAGAVTERYIPRVLLSDETGLGKTIEACLIINRLLLSDQISRVLLVVPDSLVHQWFIELYRRFNLSFTLLNKDFEGESFDNQFAETQTGIISFSSLLNSETLRDNAVEAGFDLVVVDEAHHLEVDSPLYSFLKKITGKDKGLILLTATPEQLGEENHFNHLSLLDPSRYSKFEDYRKEKKAYRKSAGIIEELLKEKNYEDLEKELDQLGPGRAVFRNTRETIKGFPEREGILYPLVVNDDTDPKLGFLYEILGKLKDEKTLLICESEERYNQVDSFLTENVRMNIARFNEKMTILQRDRSAAWFSEKDGAQLLVCSSIGGEGRNFQFAGNLILMDLPFNPELIEQRIGRLDRIGQKNRIKIHIPYLKDEPEEILARWFGAVGIFEKNISGIHQIYMGKRKGVLDLMEETDLKGKVDETKLSSLIEDTVDFRDELLKKLKEGKDTLLELNSFRKEPAEKLLKTIRDEDSEDLDDFMLRVFDYFEVPYGDTTKRTYRLYLSKVDSAFPKPPLKSDEMIVTFERSTALQRDDIDFLTLDHPLVYNCIDMLLAEETGNTSIVEMKGGPGILLEAVFISECVAPSNLQIKRFFPRKPLRVVINHFGETVTDKYPFDKFRDLKEGDKSVLKIPEVKETVIPKMLDRSYETAQIALKEEIEKASEKVHKDMGAEYERLKDLKKKNPGIRESEISELNRRIVILKDHIGEGRIRLDSLRIVLMQ